LKRALEAALLTASEFSSGCGAWKQFENPFLALEGGGGGGSSSSSSDAARAESAGKL